MASHWWSRHTILRHEPFLPEDLNREDYPRFAGRMRLRIVPTDPVDICNNLAHNNERVLVEFEQVDGVLWQYAYQTFCNEGGFVIDNGENSHNFIQEEGTEIARVIFDEFSPEGTMITRTHSYSFHRMKRDTTVDFFFWESRNPQSSRRLRNAFAHWRGQQV